MRTFLPTLRPLLSACALVVLSAVSAFASEADDKAAAFSKLANGVIEQTVAGSLNVAGIEKDVAAMEEIAVYFAGQYKAKYPTGAKLMDFMVAQKDGLAKMNLADIDANFESEAINKAHGKEFGFDLTTEANEHFGNPVDLFVHPATALICAKLWEKDHQADHLKRIQSELQEVVEHCQHVMEKLK